MNDVVTAQRGLHDLRYSLQMIHLWLSSVGCRLDDCPALTSFYCLYLVDDKVMSVWLMTK